MKHVITTLAFLSTISIVGGLVGCNKTKKATVATTDSTDSTAQLAEMEVEVEVEGGEIVVMVNGKEQVIELSEILGGMDLNNIDGEMSIAVMAFADEEGGPKHIMKTMSGPGMNGEHGGPPPEMREHMMQMMRGHGGEHGDHGGSPPEMREHMMQMMRGHGGEHGDHGGSPPEMREHMMQMMRGHGGEHGNHCDIRSQQPNQHEKHGEWSPHHGEREAPEVVQFIQELGMLGEVSAHLEDGQSVALMGIHMIRDTLDGELQMDSLTAIIEDAESGSPSRNAALIVAIQALQDEGDDEAAAELMVELVLSN